MTANFTGGCACGAVRYECDAPPMFTWICHCRECQRATGGAGGVNAVFLKTAVRFTRGAPKYHDSVGSAGHKTHRGFCAECGSPLAARADLFPEIHGVSVASLDHPEQVRLDAHIWTASAQPWDYMDPALPKFPGTPSAEDLATLAAARASS